MAITNVGFDGSVSAVEFAQLSQHQGTVFPVVCGKNDLAVAANPSSTLTCTIQPGASAGQGVKTTSDTVASVTFSAVVTTGQTRWDAVVLRRNWASGGSASFVVVQGSAAASAPMVLPSGVDLSFDSTHDHVLALVQITYGSTVPTQVVDRRAQAHKVFTFPSASALPTASLALYGMVAELPTGERYKCLTDSGGSPVWESGIPYLSRYRNTTLTMTTSTNYTVDFNVSEDIQGGMAYSAGVVTVPKAGIYSVDSAIHFQSTDPDGQTTLFILKNGSVWRQKTVSYAGENASHDISGSFRCAAGDTVAIRAFQNTGSNMTLFGSAVRYTYLDITYLGA